MKKNFKMIFAAAAAFAMVLSCSKEENPSQGTQGAGSADSLTPITISATLTDNMTKVSFTPSYDGGKPQSLALAWEAEDKLRVYNHDDRTQFEDFEIAEESIGQKTGSFIGEIFTAASYDVEVINGEVGYAEQTQPADGETASLKYLASATGVTDLKAVVFTEQSSVLAITALMPEGAAAAVASVELTASEAIFSTGKTLTINLAQKGDAGNDGILHLYATLPVGDQQIAEGTTLLVRFNAPDTDHTVYTRYVELGAQAFEAGKLNTINVNASQSDKHAGLTSCDGTTAEKAYLIGDKYQLNAMSGLVSADATSHISMIADVDFGGSAWTSASGNVAFEGNNHKISNVVAAGGLFASLGGSVQNLTIDNVKITTNINNVGIIANQTVTNAEIKGISISNSSVTGRDLVGSLVGQLDGSVENVNVVCDVKGGSKVGGLVGNMIGGSLTDAKVSGNVTCTYQYAGGFVAEMNAGMISNCSSGSAVSYEKSATYAYVGGFIGTMTGGSITTSCATGSVSISSSDMGGAFFGGFIGHMKSGSITVDISKCYATGNVTCTRNYVGGFIGASETGIYTVSDCYSTGDVSGSAYNAGLLGSNSGTITVQNCYTKSKILSSNAHSACVFAGNQGGTVKCTGFIGWNVSNKKWAYGKSVIEGNYMGTTGTISAKAKEFGWDETIWDLNGDDPKLKWTLPSNK